MEQDADSPPTLWLQPPRSTTHRRPPIHPVALIIFLPILILLLFFFLSPLISHIPETIKPTSLKFSWELLNVFLVFFAILCGVLAPRNNNLSTTADATNPGNNLVPEDYEYREKVQVDGELRSSTWHPDLRQRSVWEKDGNWMRFSDDFGVDLQYSSLVNNRSRRSDEGKERIYGSETVSGDICHRHPESEAEDVISGMGGSMVELPKVPESMVGPPAPDPPLSVKLRRRRTSRSLSRDETVKITSRIDEVHEVSDTPPPPPTPPPAKSEHRLHMKHNRLQREVREATTEMETTIASLDDQRKRERKNKQKTKNTQPLIPSIPQHPPPPPPPPSRFHNMFKKEIKNNGSHTKSAAQPPSPPPPPRSTFSNFFKSSSKSKRFHSSKNTPPMPPPSSIINIFTKTVTKNKHLDSSSAAITPPPPPLTPRPITTVTSKQESKRMSHIQPPSLPTSPNSKPLRQRPVSRDKHKPPLPTKASNNYERDNFLATGSKSSPPLKMPATINERRVKEDGDACGPNPISSPSPDVNAKAERFISRCKAEWRMDKLNSLKNKVGPISSTSPK